MNNDTTDITCYGCLTNQPNQLAHMDYGGCIYTLYIDSIYTLYIDKDLSPQPSCQKKKYYITDYFKKLNKDE